MRGIDYAWVSSTPSPAALKAADALFICRYLSPDPSKNLTKAEADAALAADLAVVVIWESTADRMKAGRQAGTDDARGAEDQLRSLGLEGMPVYFACDFDAAPGDQDAINAYLVGARDVLGASRTGIYGGYWPVSRARAAGLAAYTWGSPAWSGTEWQTCGWTPHIMQGSAATIAGQSVDWDTSAVPDFGQYPPLSREPQVREGDDGAAVCIAQELLNQHDRAGLVTDGRFGARTLAAVQAFQAAHSLSPDGVVGPVTWAALTGLQEPPAWTYGPPQNLQVINPGYTSVKLSWGRPEGSPQAPAEYNVFIYRGSQCDLDTLVDSYPRPVSTMTFDGGGLARGTLYTAHVVAEGPDGTHIRPDTFACAQFTTGTGWLRRILRALFG